MLNLSKHSWFEFILSAVERLTMKGEKLTLKSLHPGAETKGESFDGVYSFACY
jgi:hypothetical protein